MCSSDLIDPNAPAVNLVDPGQSTVPDEPPEEYGPYTEAIAVPGKVQAENYNKGGAEVAYHDLSTGNEGGKLRKDDVDIYQPNMGVVVGHNQKGEWLKYTVNVAADGEYDISALVASDNTTGSFVLYMDEQRIGEEIASEGKGFDNFTEVSGGKATLKKGEHELKLEITNDWIDIDYVEFKAASTTAMGQKIRLDVTEAEANFAVVNLQGSVMCVIKAQNTREAIEKLKNNVSYDIAPKGVYFVVSNPGTKHQTMQKVVRYE